MPLNKQMSKDARYWFDFDDQDLIANRQGHMSRRQLDNIQKDARLRRVLVGSIGIVTAFFLIGSFVLFANRVDLQWLALSSIVLMLVVICLILFRNLYVDNPKTISSDS